MATKVKSKKKVVAKARRAPVAASPLKATPKAPAKPTVPVARTTIRAQTITHPNNPVLEDGVPKFSMICTIDGRRREFPCTKEVYTKIKEDHLTQALRNDFDLKLSDGVVTHIGLKNKPLGVRGFDQVPEESTTPATSANLVVVNQRDTLDFNVEFMPTDMPDSAADEVLSLLAGMAPESIKAGTMLDNRCKIVEVRNLEERTLITVRPPR